MQSLLTEGSNQIEIVIAPAPAYAAAMNQKYPVSVPAEPVRRRSSHVLKLYLYRLPKHRLMLVTTRFLAWAIDIGILSLGRNRQCVW